MSVVAPRSAPKLQSRSVNSMTALKTVRSSNPIFTIYHPSNTIFLLAGPWCENGYWTECLYFFGLGRSAPITTDKPCGKKARDVGDFCDKPGNTWCQDHQVLTCSDEYRITSTGKACGTKARDVNDPCPKPGATWCQDYQVLTCSDKYRIVDTGARCST